MPGVASTAELGRSAFARQAWGEALTLLAAGEPLDVEDSERLAVAVYLVGRDEDSARAWQRAHVECVRLGDRDRAARCAFVVDAAYRAGGGTSVYQHCPLQRRLRDIHAITQHFLVKPDTLGTAGAILAGQDIEITVF